MGVAGYGYNRPLTSKEDEYGRATNRRVEIILLNNRYLEDELNLNVKTSEGSEAAPAEGASGP
jgi:hypothetical protein